MRAALAVFAEFAVMTGLLGCTGGKATTSVDAYLDRTPLPVDSFMDGSLSQDDRPDDGKAPAGSDAEVGTPDAIVSDAPVSEGLDASDASIPLDGSPSPDPDAGPSFIDIGDPWGLVLEHSNDLFVTDDSEQSPGIFRINLATDEAAQIAAGMIVGSPQYIANNAAGDLFISTGHGETVVRVESDTGTAAVLAGNGMSGYADGVGTQAQFTTPNDLAADDRGNLYVSDVDNHTIRRIIIATGEVSTFAGAPLQAGYLNRVGMDARFKNPDALAYDVATNALFVADTGNSVIRRIDAATGAVTTLAGNGRAGTVQDGTGTEASFDFVGSLSADGNGSLYAGDRATIRKITIGTGQVTTIAGHLGGSVARDGVGSAGYLVTAHGMALDGREGIYFSDCQTVRKLDLGDGTIQTLYGFPDDAHAAILGCLTRGRPLIAAAGQ